MRSGSIELRQLTPQNFGMHSLDAFVRHQEVTECWRCVGGKWKLLPIAFSEDWDLSQCQSVARAIAEGLNGRLIGYGAFAGDAVVGYVTVGTAPLGSRGQYVQLAEFEVSEGFRGQGIGRRLFALACGAARSLGAEKLYISAHSSKESQAAYRALGCVHAAEIDAALAAAEPCDVQMEFVL